MKSKLVILLLLCAAPIVNAGQNLQYYIDEYSDQECERNLEYYYEQHLRNPDEPYFEFMLRKWEYRCE